MSSRGLRAITLLVCSASLCAAVYSAWRCDFTLDEPFHLGWSERLLETGETERNSRERFNSKTPVLIANVLTRKAAAALGARDARVLRLAARSATLAWLLLLFAATFGLARSLSGEQAAAIATVGVALDPNLIAHGSLATVDCLYALATLLWLWAALAFARDPSLRQGALLGLALGAAFAAKFTAVLLLLGLGFLPLASPPGAKPLWREWRRVLASLALAGVVAVAVVDLAYLGKEVGRPLREPPLVSRPLAALATAAPELRLPLPAAFLTGLDRSIESERGWGPIVLLSRAFPDGVAYYFLVCWALKTPLLLASAQLVGLLLGLRTGALRREPGLRFLALNLLLTLAYFSFFFKTQIGYRFVLMCVPLLWILAAHGLRQTRGRRLAAAWAFAVALALAENAAYLGNPLSFTNAAVWPKRQVFRLIADSNIDWGQNRDKILGSLAGAGIPASRLDPVHLLMGPNVLSVNAAAGVFDFEQHRWLREHADPVAHFGHTHLHFDVGSEVFDRFLNERRLMLPNANTRAFCPESLEYAIAPPGTQVPFACDTPPEPERVFVACVKAPRGVDLGFRVREGLLRVGRVGSDGRCDTELLQEDQVTWRRLAPGTHALCAIELPNRRPTLPYRVEGTWIVRGHAAELNVRPEPADASGALAAPAGNR